MNIKHKLTCVFALTACLPVALVAWLVIINLREQAQDSFQDSSGRELRQIDYALQQFFEAIDQNVDQYSRDPRIQAAGPLKSYIGQHPDATPMPADGDALLALFEHYARSHPTTAYLSVGLEDGTYAGWPAGQTLIDYDPRKRPWYQSALAASGTLVRTVFYWAPKDEVLMSTGRTITGSDGKVRGVYSLDVSLKQLTEKIKAIRLGQNGYLIMTEANGNVLVDSANAQHTFKRLGTLDGGLAALDQVKEGIVQVELDGVTYQANVVNSKTLGWRFIGLMPQSEVMAPAQRLTWIILVIAAAMAGLFALAGASFAGMIVRPIRSVSSGLADIAQGEGDLTRSLKVQGKDETATLAGWFNQFIDAIAQMIRHIAQASGNLQQASAASSEVAAELNSAALRQREAVEQVSTSFNEMVTTSNEVARACNQAADSATGGQDDVQAGQQQIDDATRSVGGLSDNLEHATRALQVLEQDSQNINTILDTIRSIAEQTNLLALNAAIEAARAGDQGRGFAVVADEVRALARRTADSTGEIDTLLDNLARRTREVTQHMSTSLGMSHQSVERIRQARDSFDRVRNAVEQIRDQNTQIATAAAQQHQVAEGINRHITRIHTDALRVEQLAQNAHLDAGTLQQVSRELQGLVTRFKV